MLNWGPEDAVAAGTVAAWTSLVANDVTTNPSLSCPSVISKNSLASIVVFLESILREYSTLSVQLSRTQAQAIAAFTFGLACGSASCLQEQNSVLDVCDVNALLLEMILCPPDKILTSSIRR
jgi:hypothetical protein